MENASTTNRLLAENGRLHHKLNHIIALLEDRVIEKKPERFIDIAEVRTYTGLSASTIRRALKKKTLHASSTTGKHLFKVTEVERWLNQPYERTY